MVKLGDKLPDANLIRMGNKGPEAVSLSAKFKGRKVALFAVPGAFTPTCSSAHVPSFIRTIDAMKAKGVDEVICISVNDAHVMKAWGEATGATKAGITMLADADSAFSKALGMTYDAPRTGMLARSKRYAMLVEDGEVTVFNPEVGTGVCEISAGETLLQSL